MKKIFGGLLICIMVICLAGCGKKDSSAANNTDNTNIQEEEEVFATEKSCTDFSKFNDNTELIEIEDTPNADLTTVVEQYESAKDEIFEGYDKIAASSDMPCINITTEDSSKIESKDYYVASVIDVFNCDDEFVLSGAGAGVKVRGNSTADQGDEKPYRIKFEEAHNMLGLHDGKEYKSWVLLRSYWNFTPDFMAFNLADMILGDEYYHSDYMYVDLYINGKSRGIYLLCEQNQAGDGRVEVTQAKKEQTDANIGYLIEMDNYPGDDHPYFDIDSTGMWIEDATGKAQEISVDSYSIKSDINTAGQLELVDTYLNGVFTILYEAAENETPMMFDEAFNVVSAEGVYTVQEAVEAVIDTKSLANMLILEELVHNYDVGAGSFYMAIDFSEDSKYKKLTFLAPWDFNWAYEGKADKGFFAAAFQEPVGDVDRSNIWFIMAYKQEWFQEVVRARWNEITSKALYARVDEVSEHIELYRDALGYDSWRIDSGQDIVRFVTNRIEWLDRRWLD